MLVGAAHVVARRLEQARQRAHPRPADADQMYLHRAVTCGHALRGAGGNWVAKRFTSIVNWTVKSLKQPQLALAGAAGGVPT